MGKIDYNKRWLDYVKFTKSNSMLTLIETRIESYDNYIKDLDHLYRNVISRDLSISLLEHEKEKFLKYVEEKRKELDK